MNSRRKTDLGIKHLFKPILIVSAISLIVALSVPITWLMVLNSQKSDSFLGSLPAWLVYPGYKLAAILFPQLARNESAGLTLLPQSLVLNFLFYFLTTFVLSFVIFRIWRMRRAN